MNKFLMLLFCFIHMFLGFPLVASHEDARIVAEVIGRDSANLTTVGNQAGASSRLRSYLQVERGGSSGLSSDSKSKMACGTLTFLVLAGIGFGFGFGFEPHTYRVYNRESDSIDVRYRPGCTKTTKDSDGHSSTKTVDCVKTIYPDNHAKIMTNGDLTKLCAEYTWGGFSYECTTNKGLKDYDWYVHDGLTFTRGKDSSSTDSAVNGQFSMNYTAQELDSLAIDLKKQEKIVSHYLRGTKRK